MPGGSWRRGDRRCCLGRGYPQRRSPRHHGATDPVVACGASMLLPSVQVHPTGTVKAAIWQPAAPAHARHKPRGAPDMDSTSARACLAPRRACGAVTATHLTNGDASPPPADAARRSRGTPSSVRSSSAAWCRASRTAHLPRAASVPPPGHHICKRQHAKVAEMVSNAQKRKRPRSPPAPKPARPPCAQARAQHLAWIFRRALCTCAAAGVGRPLARRCGNRPLIRGSPS